MSERVCRGKTRLVFTVGHTFDRLNRCFHPDEHRGTHALARTYTLSFSLSPHKYGCLTYSKDTANTQQALIHRIKRPEEVRFFFNQLNQEFGKNKKKKTKKKGEVQKGILKGKTTE